MITRAAAVCLLVYYAVRFLVAAGSIPLQPFSGNQLLLFSLSLAAAALCFFLLRGSWMGAFWQYLKKHRAVFELFVWFLVSQQILSWVISYLNDLAGRELRSFFIAFWLWIVFSLLACTFSVNFSRLFSRPAGQTGGADQRTRKIIFTAGGILIAFAVLGYWLYTEVIHPLPYFHNYDPEFPYFLNSLTPFRDLELYQRMDHPGTFTQLIGSAIHLVTSPWSIISGQDPVTFHFQNPQVFLLLASLFIITIHLGMLWLLIISWQDFSDWTAVLAGLTVLMAYFAAHRLSFDFLNLWSPNSFNFGFGTLVLLLLFLNLTQGSQPDDKQLYAVSTAAGVVATFQVYMTAWILGVSAVILFYKLRSGVKPAAAWKAGFLSLIQGAKGYLLATLTILFQYPSILDWIKRLTLHQGRYGQGEQGIISLKSLSDNLPFLWQFSPGFFLIAGLGLLGFLLVMFFSQRKTKIAPAAWALAGGLFIQAALLVAMVIKHPGDRYLLSGAATLPILLAAVFQLLKQAPRLKKIVIPAIFLLTLFFFSSNFLLGIRKHNRKVSYFQRYTQEVSEFLNQKAELSGRTAEDITLLWTYGSYSPCYSYWFGNDWAKNLFQEEIHSVCPEEYALDIWTGEVFPQQEGIDIDHLPSPSVIIGDPNRLTRYDYDSYGKLYHPDVNRLGFILVE